MTQLIKGETTMKTYEDGDRLTYRGMIIWCFDGYFDVHEEVDAHPIAEGLSTPEEAMAFIDKELNDQRWLNAINHGSITFNFQRRK